MPRREAHDAADPRLTARDEQPFGHMLFRRVGLQGRKIVIEYEIGLVVQILRAAGSRISRTHIALGIVCDDCLRESRLDLALPRPLRPARRDKHPFARQRIESSVGVLGEVEWHPFWLEVELYGPFYTIRRVADVDLGGEAGSPLIFC